MNSDLTLLLISAGVALAAGLVLGLLIAMLFRRMTARAPSGVALPAANEILRIDDDPVARKLVLRLSGRPVSGVDSIADADVREHVRALMWLLAPQTETTEVAAAQVPARPVVAHVTAEPRVAVPAAPIPSPDVLAPFVTVAPLSGSEVNAGAAPGAPDELTAPFLSRLTNSLWPQPAPAPLKPAPVTLARPAKGNAAGTPPADMFEQINAILHRKLSAHLHAPDITLYAEDGELRILVGNEVFRRVEDVQDEQARGWIREAVGEWEAG